MENKELSKSVKMKFILVLFLSNTSIFLFTSYSHGEIENKIISGPRQDYILLKVAAENKTAFDTTTPIQMISKDHRTIIKNVFVLEKIDVLKDHLSHIQTQSSYYLIHIHLEDAKRINLSKEFVFFPNNYSIRKSISRRKYEVIF